MLKGQTQLLAGGMMPDQDDAVDGGSAQKVLPARSGLRRRRVFLVRLTTGRSGIQIVCVPLRATRNQAVLRLLGLFLELCVVNPRHVGFSSEMDRGDPRNPPSVYSASHWQSSRFVWRKAPPSPEPNKKAMESSQFPAAPINASGLLPLPFSKRDKNDNHLEGAAAQFRAPLPLSEPAFPHCPIQCLLP